jgi:hypothetical protein
MGITRAQAEYLIKLIDRSNMTMYSEGVEEAGNGDDSPEYEHAKTRARNASGAVRDYIVSLVDA